MSAASCGMRQRSFECRNIVMIQNSLERKFIRLAMTAPYLERDEEQELAQNWRDHGDQEALNRMTMAHMRLVISMAGKFRNYGLPIGDLIQEGHVGLLEAAARFEPEREVRFSTYATWWIRASMQEDRKSVVWERV